MERVPVVRVRGRGVQITDEIRARVQDRVGRSTRYFSRVGDVDVNLVKLDHRPAGGQRFRAEIATRSARHDVRAEGLGDTVDRALDAAADRFAARLRRLGERLIDRRKQRSKGPKRAAAQGGAAPPRDRSGRPGYRSAGDRAGEMAGRQTDDPGRRRIGHGRERRPRPAVHRRRIRRVLGHVPAGRRQAGVGGSRMTSRRSIAAPPGGRSSSDPLPASSTFGIAWPKPVILGCGIWRYMTGPAQADPSQAIQVR